MIPLKLHIKNFVSYGSTTQTIDFTPYNLICLSGKNGHGKSALLDAMTWVLWGQARKVVGLVKADEGLMRLGQTSMMVSLDFLCNGINYRVRREFSLQGKGSTSLDFAILDNQTLNYKPLTDKTIKATQTKIETMIGLDYESFINSAFLRQGQSNEFSKKSPKDRKEVLANILGLNQFELLRKKAAEKSKDALNKKEYINQIHFQLKHELSQKNNIDAQLDSCKKSLCLETENESNFKILLNNIKDKLAIVNSKKEKYNQLVFEIEQLNNNIEHIKIDCITNITNYRKFLKQQRSLIDIGSLENEQHHLQIQLQAIREVNNKKIELKELLINKKEEEKKEIDNLGALFTKQISQYNKQLDNEAIAIQTINNKIDDLEKNLNDENKELILSQKELENYNSDIPENKGTVISESLESIEKQFERRKAYYQKFINCGNWLKTELTNTTQKKLISNCNDAICPMCQQNITDSYKDNLCKMLNKKELLLNHQITRLGNVIKQLKNLLIVQNNIIDNFRKKIELEKINSIKKSELEKKISKIKINIEQFVLTTSSAKKKLEEHLANQREIINLLDNANKEHAFNLANNEHLQQLKTEIIDLENSLSKIVDNKLQEESIQKQLNGIIQKISDHANVIKESAKQEQRKEMINGSLSHIKEIKKIKNNKQNELLKVADYKIEEIDLTLQENQIGSKIQDIVQKKEYLISAKGGLERQLVELEKKQSEFAEQEKSIKLLESSANDFSIISHALSKDGIQALLIEDALPEIEHEANLLLSRLTDNTAQISLESLRDLRSGGTKETLDIKISDPLGIRAYELFSGGEAFRIDFALRIAISKLLARRAGTSLQTLIIDEGFGSQDEEGLNNIMEAIHAIGNDFSKIIIVSHLPVMKEQFPVHFFVSKGAHGSSIKVIENA